MGIRYGAVRGMFVLTFPWTESALMGALPLGARRPAVSRNW